MARARWTDMKAQKLAAMTSDERRDYERGYADQVTASRAGMSPEASRAYVRTVSRSVVRTEPEMPTLTEVADSGVGVLLIGFPDGAEIVNFGAALTRAAGLVPFGLTMVVQ